MRDSGGAQTSGSGGDAARDRPLTPGDECLKHTVCGEPASCER